MIRAAVFNSYLNTWGGGERSTYAIATVLSRMDLDVEVVTFEAHVPTPDEIESFFGPGYSGFRLRTLAPATAHRDEVLREYLADKALFINHSASSSFPNPCPFGLYSVMFPFQDGGAWVRSSSGAKGFRSASRSTFRKRANASFSAALRSSGMAQGSENKKPRMRPGWNTSALQSWRQCGVASFLSVIISAVPVRSSSTRGADFFIATSRS